MRNFAVYWCFCMTIAAVSPQMPSDQSILNDIFGPPPTPATTATSTSSPRFEDITRRTTDSSSVFVDKNGDACKCVPYYLCDEHLVAVDQNNVTVTGWGQLDIRFREDECQESTERCCKNPKTKEEFKDPDPIGVKACGYRNPRGLDFTVTGGSGLEAQFGEFPWVVALIDGMGGSYIGVGVILHPNVVMTGAHVAIRSSVGVLRVRAGEWDTQTVKERLPYQERTVDEIYLHSDFNAKTLKNNVALLRMNEPLALGDHINVICMPEQDMSFDESKGCVASGWGKDVFGLEGRYAVILKRVDQDMIPNGRCNELLKRTRLGRHFNLHQSFVCAGGIEGMDTCQGDGGAPLACPIGDDQYKLAGLVSWGIECGKKDHPAVYARVAMFRKWVDEKMTLWGYDPSVYSA